MHLISCKETVYSMSWNVTIILVYRYFRSGAPPVINPLQTRFPKDTIVPGSFAVTLTWTLPNRTTGVFNVTSPLPGDWFLAAHLPKDEGKISVKVSKNIKDKAVITGLKMRESFLLLTRAKLVDYEKCLMFMVVHVRSSRHLCIYNWSCSLPHSQWVAFMGSHLKVSAVISELVIDFFFKWDYVCVSCQCSLFRLGCNLRDNGIFLLYNALNIHLYILHHVRSTLLF